MFFIDRMQTFAGTVTLRLVNVRIPMHLFTIGLTVDI